jgi:hypothetical protein
VQTLVNTGVAWPVVYSALHSRWTPVERYRVRPPSQLVGNTMSRRQKMVWTDRDAAARVQEGDTRRGE